MRKEKKSLVDTIWFRIKNNSIFAILIVIGTVVIGMASFSGSVKKLLEDWNIIKPAINDIVIIDDLESDSTYKDYFNKNFLLSENSVSDILNISKGGIDLDLSLIDQGGNLKYVLEKGENKQITINPCNDYLRLLKTGGIIRPVDNFGSPFDFQFPVLDFKIVNNSKQTVLFKKAIIAVSASKPDSFPVLILRKGYTMNFPIENIGWGQVYNCTISFNLVTPDQPLNLKNGLGHKLKVGDFFSEPEKIDLSECFEKLGVKTKFARRKYPHMRSGGVDIYTIIDANGHKKELNEMEYEKFLSDARGPFKDGVAKMYGEITYEGRNSSGKIMGEKFLFENEIYMDEEPVGMPMPPSYVYDVMLESNKTSYKREVSLSQVIKANETDRFNIKIAAPISSRHQFSIILFYNNNKELVVRNLSLNYFVSSLDYYKIKEGK